MDDVVMRAMLKWPDVPDVYGWLLLDRRGSWRIRDPLSAVFTPIGNRSLVEFIARNYSTDDRGCWYFQNGPQRVFVSLAYAPFAFRLADGALLDQCGGPAQRPEGAWLDEEGSLLLCASGRVGLLDDRDLGRVAEDLARGVFRAGKANVPLGAIRSGDVPGRFKFVRDPKPAG